MNLSDETIAIIGLGYVGLPLAVEFGKRRPVVGFDIPASRIDELRAGRDFRYIDNAVQANLLAATDSPEAENQVYNVAVGDRTSLNQLFNALKNELSNRQFHLNDLKPTHRDFRAGDVLHSLADISKAKKRLVPGIISR